MCVTHDATHTSLRLESSGRTSRNINPDPEILPVRYWLNGQVHNPNSPGCGTGVSYDTVHGQWAKPSYSAMTIPPSSTPCV